jgi:hypothetical protein
VRPETFYANGTRAFRKLALIRVKAPRLCVKIISPATRRGLAQR